MSEAPKKKRRGLKIFLIIFFLLLLLGGGAAAGAVFAVKYGFIELPFLNDLPMIGDWLKEGKKKQSAEKVDSKKESGSEKELEAVKKSAEELEPKKEEPAPEKTKPKVTVEEENLPEIDAVKGAKKLANIWNGIESQKLLDIVNTWPDDRLAFVMFYMDPGQTGALLKVMDPVRSAKISELIQAVGSGALKAK